VFVKISHVHEASPGVTFVKLKAKDIHMKKKRKSSSKLKKQTFQTVDRL